MSARRRFRMSWSAAGATWIIFVAWMALEPGGGFLAMAFDDVLEGVVATVAAVLCWRTARGHRGATRRAWRFLAAGTGSWAAGEFTWSYYEIIARREVPFPSPADVGFLGMVPLVAVALLSFPSAPARITSRVRTLVDGLILGGAVLVTAWATFLAPVYRATTGSVAERVIGLAYPFSDVALVGLVIFASLRAGARLDTSLTLIGAGITAICISDGAFAYMTTAGSYDSVGLIGLGWVVGFSLIALATQRPTPTAVTREQVAPLRLSDAVLPYAAGALAIVVVAAKAIAHDLDTVLIWAGGTLLALVFVRQVLTLLDRIALENALQRQAFHDPLTGLANRALFRDRAAHAIARRPRDTSAAAVVFIDLDDFKTTNDSLGHAAGDALLLQVARRLEDVVRAGDTAARLGGDEFALLLEGLQDANDAVTTCERVLDALAPSFGISGHEIAVGASIGIATIETGSESVEDLLRHADVAMYSAKAQGKGRIEVYQAGMHAVALGRGEMQASLRRALDERQLALDYQPVVELASGRIVGAEALVRWHHPVHGLLPPRDFIPLAEQSGLIVAMGRWVLDEALAVAAGWRDMADPPAWIAVNLSARQLHQPSLVHTVTTALARHEVRPASLQLEIAETDLMNASDVALDALQELRRVGVRIALDDFGAGISSLSHLRHIPLDVLKIDRAFVSMLGSGPRDADLVDLVQRLANTLGLTTIAQGIETQQQLSGLVALGTRLGQGYFLTEPVPPEGLRRLAYEMNRPHGLRSA